MIANLWRSRPFCCWRFWPSAGFPWATISATSPLRWQTTTLTAAAFTLVIGLLIVMMAFVHGMKRLTEETGQPGNVIVLSDGASDEIISNLTIGDLSEIENLPLVVRQDGRPLASRETYLVACRSCPIRTASGRNAASSKFAASTTRS